MPSQLTSTKPIHRIVRESDGEDHTLHRSLSATQLVSLGIGGIIGAGLFSLTGIVASHNAGPAIVLSFLLAAVACGLAALCYSELSTMIPVAGSAYTYAYATLGELVAWIIGWDLVLEYAIGAAAVSVSWSGYVVSLLHQIGVPFPTALAASPFELTTLPDGSTPGAALVNLPAVVIVSVISLLLMLGIRESARFNSAIVVLKVGVVLLFIVLGAFYMDPANHVPFLPPNTGRFGEFGWTGVVQGAGVIFFAYIGFDAVSTAAQEAKNPAKDMPIGIIGSLLVCTVLYVAFAYVLTGMVHYPELNSPAPVALAIDRTPFGWLRMAVKLAIIAGFTSVILVLLLGQSRVCYSMARDGLLPRTFAEVHPRFRTPWKSNLAFMAFVGLLAAFAPMSALGEMTSIGTLFAFTIVCAGVLVVRRTQPDAPRPFRTPLVPWVPVLGIAANLYLMWGLQVETWYRLFGWLAIGLLLYFAYGYHHSRLAAGPTVPPPPVADA
ncbi:MAG: amino acid permease [Polyangiaceae bacterium]|nr:amino acid permease [Polyangiaceae bacterium]